MKYLLSVLLIFVFVKSYSQNNLIGTWRRIGPYVKHVTMDSSKVQIGDLTLYPAGLIVVCRTYVEKDV